MYIMTILQVLVIGFGHGSRSNLPRLGVVAVNSVSQTGLVSYEREREREKCNTFI